MPCRVDLFQGYNWYDQYDLADHMYYNTPLVPLMCEVMKLIESKGMLDEYSDLVQKWYEYHKKDDEIRERTGERLRYYEHHEELKPFIGHMNSIGFSVTTGILTEEQIKQRTEEADKRDKEYEEYRKKKDIKREAARIQEESIIQKRSDAVTKEIVATIGHDLPRAEREQRLRAEYETVAGSKDMIEVYYLDGKEILRYDQKINW